MAGYSQEFTLEVFALEPVMTIAPDINTKEVISTYLPQAKNKTNSSGEP